MAKKKKEHVSILDSVMNKSVYMNGKKLSGVQAVSLEYDIDKIVTKIHLTMYARNGSIEVTDTKISFNEVAHVPESNKGN